MATATKEKQGYVPRLKQTYNEAPRAPTKDETGLSTVMQVPAVSKITLNMGVGEAKTEAKALDSAIEEYDDDHGQQAQVNAGLAGRSPASRSATGCRSARA